MALTSSAPRPEAGRLCLGLLGGTFDPIHLGHLVIAEEARARLGLDKVLFIPAKIPPHKTYGTYAPTRDRLCMVQLALADNPHFGFSCVDLEREGPSFTLDTLSTIRGQYGPGVELFFILGADSLVNLKGWHRPQEIIRLTRLVATSRPGYTVDLAALEVEVPGISQVTELLTSIEIGISSTDLRARVRRGWPIKYQVPAAVETYIREHKLYL